MTTFTVFDVAILFLDGVSGNMSIYPQTLVVQQSDHNSQLYCISYRKIRSGSSDLVKYF